MMIFFGVKEFVVKDHNTILKFTYSNANIQIHLEKSNGIWSQKSIDIAYLNHQQQESEAIM